MLSVLNIPIVVCLRPCVNGDCDAAPEYCKCKRGWFGDACDECTTNIDT